MKAKKNETFTADQITLKNNTIDAVMNFIVPKVEGLVKEVFDSFATDYWKELKTVTKELAQLKKSQEFILAKLDLNN